MTNKRWLIIGTDERMKLLAKKLTHPSRTIYYKCTDKWDALLNAAALEFHPQRIILPIQPLHLEVEELFGIQQAHVFAGKLTEQWREQLKQQPLYFYLENEAFIWRNAALTAEAMLAHLYKEGIALQGKKVLITGFGRVAKMLAQLFSQLKAEIIIAVRSETQRAEALAYGYTALDLSPSLQQDAHVLINTIPARWLTSDYVALLTMPIYDLASAPGCLQGQTLSQYELLPALPGKYFAKDAAHLLYETIVDQLGRGDSCSKEEE